MTGGGTGGVTGERVGGTATGPVLVTGGSGQLGRWLSRLGGEQVVAPGRAELDVTDPESIRAALDEVRPAWVIGAGAYTAVDAAEGDEETARAVNAVAAGALAEATRAAGAHLVHVSTDYVFSGEVPAGGTDGPALTVDAPTGPRSAYGRTKLAGERAVRAADPAATIVRTAWVYTGPGRAELGLTGDDFVTTMLRLEREHAEIRVVDDQTGSPTYAHDLAAGLLELVRRGDAGRTLHAAGAGRTTWWGLARAVFAEVGADPDRVVPCTTADFPRPAPRPAFSVLSGAEWAAAGLTPLRGWEAALAEAMEPAVVEPAAGPPRPAGRQS